MALGRVDSLATQTSIHINRADTLMPFKRILSTATISACALALLSACSASEDAGSKEGTTSAAVPSDDLLAKLTPEYLTGPWCHVGVEFPDETSEENRTYAFAADGTLKYQNNPSTPVEKDGSYEIKDGALVIKPTLMMIPLKPLSVEADEMTFSAMGGKAIWKRGACGTS